MKVEFPQEGWINQRWNASTVNAALKQLKEIVSLLVHSWSKTTFVFVKNYYNVYDSRWWSESLVLAGQCHYTPHLQNSSVFAWAKKPYYIRYNSSNTHLVLTINLCLHYSSANSMAMLAAHTLYCGVWCIFHPAGVWQNGVGKWGSSFITVLADCSLELPKVARNGGDGAGEMEGRKWRERDKPYQTSASNFSSPVSKARHPLCRKVCIDGMAFSMMAMKTSRESIMNHNAEMFSPAICDAWKA